MSNRSLGVAMFAVLILSALIGAANAEGLTARLWADVSPTGIMPTGDRLIVPQSYRTLSLDLSGMKQFLASVPLEGTGASNRSEISLPLPDGGFGRFSIVESSIMAPELQSQYPEIRTYAGYGIDDRTATIRFDVTPHGFHAMVLSNNGTIFIDPYQRGDTDHYQTYYRRDYVSDKSLGGCTVLDEDNMSAEIARLAGNTALRSGTQLRTYRTAVAADGEYTTYYGGTVPQALAGIVTSMNRVDGVYERELSIRMVLIANENLIIYTNPNTDPYTNSDGATMLNQNQSTLDSVIGSANYDIGHVFSTGGGGIAGLGVVCRTGQKAKGVTGSPAPIGDAYDIDYVAHEMGHQYGANHCFNGSAGSCSGGNRNASTAYEPGSGSTIMCYAGICGNQNLQIHSDDYFHWVSIQEIVTYTTSGAGSTCPVTTATGVIEPTPSTPSGGFSIPINTPFSLTASATTTGAATYCWEESDLGPAGHPNSPTSNAPVFRSFDPVSSPTRVFPKWSNILANTQTIGEILPSYARSLTFRVTVRDTQAGGVGVRNAGISFLVGSAGPFLVTSPNTAVVWQGGTNQTVTWNVAGTDAAPINCQTVNILLSTDGGSTWPTVLASGTPNDGSQQVFLPATPTYVARIMVQAADNIFFDISNSNFQIEYSADVAGTMTKSGLALYANTPNPFNPETTIRFLMPRSGEANLSVYDPAGRLVRTVFQGQAAAGNHFETWNGLDERGRPVSSGVYLYKLTSLGETLTRRATIVR
jgi:hypothetical protein